MNAERVLFCDTNIIRYLLDAPSRASRFAVHLREEGLVHAISLIQFTELLKLERYHAPLAQLLFDAQSHIFRWWKGIVHDEAAAYPNTSGIHAMSRPNIASHYPGKEGQDDLGRALAGGDLELLWNEIEEQKRRYKPVMDWLPSTRPRSNTPKAIDIDFTLHNHGVVLQVLRDIAPEFVETVQQHPDSFTPRLFPGAYLHAAYDYYRFILQGMKSQPSDVLDIHQVFYIPYCGAAILEKSMAGLLSRLKNERSLLGDVEIHSIRYARSITGTPKGSA